MLHKSTIHPYFRCGNQRPIITRSHSPTGQCEVVADNRVATQCSSCNMFQSCVNGTCIQTSLQCGGTCIGGTCNTATGTCTCNAGFRGTFCEIGPPSMFSSGNRFKHGCLFVSLCRSLYFTSEIDRPHRNVKCPLAHGSVPHSGRLWPACRWQHMHTRPVPPRRSGMHGAVPCRRQRRCRDQHICVRKRWSPCNDCLSHLCGLYVHEISWLYERDVSLTTSRDE